jgi:3'-phosphoadenosine 5'-phosphosulfate sulfotransferase (PAPS reductase)/FAD synthetase
VVKKTSLNLVAYRLHSYTARFKSRVDYSLECVAKAIELSGSDKWALSNSFGKDSLALMFLLNQMLPELQSIFIASSETSVLANYVDIITKLETSMPHLKIIQTDKAGLFSDSGTSSWAEATSHKTHSDMWLIDEWAAQNGFVGSFIGLRKEESRTRATALSTSYNGHEGHYCIKMINPKACGLWHACPIAEWKLEDVGAWLWQHNIPLLDTYHTEGLQARTVARASKVSVNYGNVIAFLKTRNQGKYNELINLYPDLKTKG